MHTRYEQRLCFSKRSLYVFVSLVFISIGILFYSLHVQNQKSLLSARAEIKIVCNPFVKSCICKKYDPATMLTPCVAYCFAFTCGEQSAVFDCSGSVPKLVSKCDPSNVDSSVISPTHSISSGPQKPLLSTVSPIIPSGLSPTTQPGKIVAKPVSQLSGYDSGSIQNTSKIGDLYVKATLSFDNYENLESLHLYYFDPYNAKVGSPFLEFVWIGKKFNKIDFSHFGRNMYSTMSKLANFAEYRYRARVELVSDPSSQIDQAFFNTTDSYKGMDFTNKEIFNQTRFYKITLYDGSNSVSLYAYLANDFIGSLADYKDLAWSWYGVKNNIDFSSYYRRSLDSSNKAVLDSDHIGFITNSGPYLYKTECFKDMAKQLSLTTLEEPHLDITPLSYIVNYDNYFISKEQISPRTGNFFSMGDFRSRFGGENCFAAAPPLP